MEDYGILRKATEMALVEKESSCAKVNGLIRKIANLKLKKFNNYFYEKETIRKDGANFRYIRSEYGPCSFTNNEFSICAYFLRIETEAPIEATKAEVKIFKKYKELVKDIDFDNICAVSKIEDEITKLDNEIRWLKNNYRLLYDAYFKFEPKDFLDERFLDRGYNF